MQSAPVYDFTQDNVQQTVWIIDDPTDIQVIAEEFVAAGDLYIADGHHRSASAVRVGKKRAGTASGL